MARKPKAADRDSYAIGVEKYARRQREARKQIRAERKAQRESVARKDGARGT
jgi:hypothetical protein